MSILFYFAFGFLGLRCLISLGNLMANPMLKPKHLDENPFISILIPARNEEDNLPIILAEIEKIAYPNFECIILNDHSSDKTESILQYWTKRLSSLRYVNGKALPENWLGKNWACHQLADLAKGDYLMFMDADIASIHPELAHYALSQMRAKDLSLLSLFPDQIMETWGERSVVPIMHILLLSFLPLHWIYFLPFPSMSAANGQFMFFDAKRYRTHKWHKRVKKNVIEDIAIMQEVKKLKLKGMTLLANGTIRSRMYRNYREGLHGFGKNLLAGFGNSILGLLLYIGLVIAAWFIVLPQLGIFWGCVFLLLVMVLRGSISWLSNQSIVLNWIMHPIHMLNLLLISLLSISNRFSGGATWKGRKI